jgi:hypothetical protein
MYRRWAISAVLVGFFAWFVCTWTSNDDDSTDDDEMERFLAQRQQIQGMEAAATPAYALQVYSTSLASSSTAAEQLALLAFDCVMSEKAVELEVVKAAKEVCDSELMIKVSGLLV